MNKGTNEQMNEQTNQPEDFCLIAYTGALLCTIKCIAGLTISGHFLPFVLVAVLYLKIENDIRQQNSARFVEGFGGLTPSGASQPPSLY